MHHHVHTHYKVRISWPMEKVAVVFPELSFHLYSRTFYISKWKRQRESEKEIARNRAIQKKPMFSLENNKQLQEQKNVWNFRTKTGNRSKRTPHDANDKFIQMWNSRKREMEKKNQIIRIIRADTVEKRRTHEIIIELCLVFFFSFLYSCECVWVCACMYDRSKVVFVIVNSRLSPIIITISFACNLLLIYICSFVHLFAQLNTHGTTH